MVVDDQPVTRDSTARVLREGGFRVVTCADGQEAISRALTERPDVVVLDVLMPGMSGLEVGRALKRNALLAGELLPILLLSGKGDPAHATVMYRRAFELYLEARAIEPSDDDEAVIGELARLVPANQLDERYRGGSYAGG